jgi:2-dehydropantoate 2-reductase
MKICIYGAGAVGGHFAVRLALAGEDVSIIARGPHLEAIQKDGLKLLVGADTLQARVNATDDPVKVGKQDVVIVTVKAPSLPGIVNHVKTLLADKTPIIFAMNGIPWWYFYGFDAPGRERRVDILDPGNLWWNEIGPKRAISPLFSILPMMKTA